MLCRSFRYDQTLYLFLFPSVNFTLSISGKTDRSLMQSVWNERFLFPTSLQVTLCPVAGRLQPTPETTPAPNTQHRKSQTKGDGQPMAFCPFCQWRKRSSNKSLGVLVHCLSLPATCKHRVGTKCLMQRTLFCLWDPSLTNPHYLHPSGSHLSLCQGQTQMARVRK